MNFFHLLKVDIFGFCSVRPEIVATELAKFVGQSKKYKKIL
jgi:hypothetical protein